MKAKSIRYARTVQLEPYHSVTVEYTFELDPIQAEADPEYLNDSYVAIRDMVLAKVRDKQSHY